MAAQTQGISRTLPGRCTGCTELTRPVSSTLPPWEGQAEQGFARVPAVALQPVQRSVSASLLQAGKIPPSVGCRCAFRLFEDTACLFP